MSYVTQGTVQIERKTETEAVIFISSTPNYAVKHNEKDYVVFVEAKSSQPDAESTQLNAELKPQSRLFDKKTQHFTAEVYLIEMLIKAAFKKTCIEITITIDDPPKEDPPKITALKIPAMP
jgi:fructose-specific component phosphotransferase system IIB-like protein